MGVRLSVLLLWFAAVSVAISLPSMQADVSDTVLHARRRVVSVMPLRKSKDGKKMLPYGAGGGVIVSKDGLVLTAAHVVRGSDKARVITYDGDMCTATVVRRDDKIDLALLATPKPLRALEAAALGHTPRVGHGIFVVGHPGEMWWLVTFGHVGLLNETEMTVDAAVNSGSSGGGVFDLHGRLVGIASAVYGPMAFLGFQGHAIAVSAPAIRRFLESQDGSRI